MKLISRYNRINLPLLVFIFLVSVFSSYLLVKKVLLDELDESIVHAREGIKTFVQEQRRIPDIIPTPNLKVEFRKVPEMPVDTGFQTITAVNPGQKKHRIYRKLVFPITVNNEIYRVSIVSPLEGTRHLMTVLLAITFSTIFLIIITSVILNRFILSRLWKPFYESLNLLQLFRIDKPVQIKFPRSKTDEFNLMAKSLEDAISREVDTYRSLRAFTENASHEIQTPLAIIRSKLDILIQKDGFSERESEISRSLYGALDKLSRLNRSLLLITKIENRKFEEKKIIDLQQKLIQKVSEFQELWQINNIEASHDLQTASISANEDMTDILLNNLLSNATRHNIPGGKISIILGQGLLSVSNSGGGKALDESRLFKRFYKEAQHSESNGLGLTIARQICDAAGININYVFNGREHCFQLTW